MFGLDKFTFKTKVITISVIVIIISMGIVYLNNTYSIDVVKINDWVFITNSDEGSWYYKSILVNIDNQTHVAQVLVKIVYTDKGKQDFLKTHKVDKYRDINRSLIKVSINYQKGQWHADRINHYFDSDNIIGSDELLGKSDDVIPKSVGDKLLIKIIKDYNIKR